MLFLQGVCQKHLDEILSRLKVFENMVLKSIFRTMKAHVTEERRKLHNEEFHYISVFL